MKRIRFTEEQIIAVLREHEAGAKTFRVISDLLPKIVKIDVEGHEPTVISELMKSAMRKDIHYLYFEANKSRYEVA